ncbi:hypothetical protein PMG11_01426 [Penicillium brasilianum]|uniref:Prion-inhibition and propagation HeLo domain-containing protein n=1 Tax=Penicillium brasilianum TaxID=104259 RepID=A0A0F7TI05_PENBI|nr:hypothetical protein PMG11_01426 [Penicillium brasilianum]
MVEPVGATLGAVSLATALSGIFVSVVECFEYVELGRRFGNDFDKSRARLAALKLQITRWGVATGALPDPRTRTHRALNVDSYTASAALHLLIVIRDDTIEVEQKSQKYHAQPPPISRVDLAVLSPNEIDAPTEALNSQMRAIISKRVQGVPWKRRAKWAIYEKKHFDRLLDDITENLGQLEKLLPQAAEYQKELCRIEVEEIQDGQSEAVMELLYDAAQFNKDALLEQAVREAIIAKGSGHSWERTEVGNNVKLEQGDRIAKGYAGQAPVGRVGHNYGVTIGKGHAEIRQGDIYGLI